MLFSVVGWGNELWRDVCWVFCDYVFSAPLTLVLYHVNNSSVIIWTTYMYINKMGSVSWFDEQFHNISQCSFKKYCMFELLFLSLLYVCKAFKSCDWSVHFSWQHFIYKYYKLPSFKPKSHLMSRLSKSDRIMAVE